MDHIRKILVAVDFSPCSEAALRQAVRIAALSRASVSALHVVPIQLYSAPDGSFMSADFPPVDLLLADARDRWKAWPAAREVGAGVAFDAVLGLPRMELLDRVKNDAADLLVIGAHGDDKTGPGVGPIASSCVQHAESKVLLVREGDARPFRSIAACVDFSDTSRHALEQAIRIGALDGAALHVVHVFADPWEGVRSRERLAARVPDFASRYRHGLEKSLRDFCSPFAHELGALKATYHAVQSHNHGSGIVTFVTDHRCDLVVLGTRNKWNLRDFVWGSTAERVVRDAPCSAITVRPAPQRPH